MLPPATTAWLNEAITPPDENARQQARAHQQQLTKPAGSLGRLEDLAEQFAAWQGVSHPRVPRTRVRVFAADHGIARRGVSAFPQEVTAQMIANFCSGGAAVSVLAHQWDADFGVVNLGCVTEVAPHPLLQERIIGPGTADFTEAPAMTEVQLAQALEAGREQVNQGEFALFVGGEMGIGNTSAAAALLAALLARPAVELTGPGTGINAEALNHKRRLIENALELHAAHLAQPVSALQRVGGFEIAALTGAYLASAQRGIPSLVDGFISTAAALAACRINPGVRPWLLFAHRSAEPGHGLALADLQADPLLTFNMRLGEGSGALVALPLIHSALQLHNSMATFAQAGVRDA